MSPDIKIDYIPGTQEMLGSEIRDYDTLRVLKGEKSLGELNYLWEEDHWRLDHVIVDSNLRRKNLGKSLLEAFVEKVGSNQPVVGEIDHDDTVRFLKKRYFSIAKKKGQVIIERENNLEEIPIVKFLKSGKIQTQKLIITYNKDLEQQADFEGFPYNIEFFALTE